jgi:hypothetical protein
MVELGARGCRITSSPANPNASPGLRCSASRRHDVNEPVRMRMVPFVRAPLCVHRQRRLRVQNERRAPNGRLELHRHLPPPGAPPATPPGSGSSPPPQNPGPTSSTGPGTRDYPTHHTGPRNLGNDIGTTYHRITVTPEGQHVTLPRPVPQPTPGCDRAGRHPRCLAVPGPRQREHPGYPVTRLVPLLHCHHSGVDRDHPAGCRPSPAERRR